MKISYPKFLDSTDYTIQIADSNKPFDQDGNKNIVDIHNGKCNFSEVQKIKYDRDGKKITLSGKILTGDSINADLEAASCRVFVNGKLYSVYSYSVIRNTDSSFHHTEMELML